jgi:hypothetical protein
MTRVQTGGVHGGVGEPGRGSAVPGATGRALASIVLVHLAVSVVHGQAHTGGHVDLSSAAAAFVYVVILAGPLAGLALSWIRPRAGAWIVAASFAASLVFGLLNHYIIAGADRVDHVAPEWRTLFGVTAALLLATEAAGAIVGARAALRSIRRTS